MSEFFPEGYLIDTQDNKTALFSASNLAQAHRNGKLLEAKAIRCDNEHNLVVDLQCMTGIIPREEGAIGIKEGVTRDIAVISRVGKPVCFVISGFDTDNEKNRTRAILSRRSAQEICLNDFISKLIPGDIINAKVTHMENFGAFADIGCGIISFLPIDCISISRIFHPCERFKIGMNIRVAIKSIIGGRINLTHKELLGTWEENAQFFHIGETISGIARSIEDYGVFIELTPNLAGLAELKENVRQGQHTSVYIKNIIPEKMKIKLVIIENFDSVQETTYPKYFFKGNHISKFLYSPPMCSKIIETNFEMITSRA
ncbi:MAG: S1 RNA-binding domain-containing protein [Oscillospiraceae bacterium]|jgi:small subunit ribosomal protein S1|nr:S1 RNA-binding domain-containing protein [Oscillospiraceae bacterium]